MKARRFYISSAVVIIALAIGVGIGFAGIVRADNPPAPQTLCPKGFLCMPIALETKDCPAGYMCMPTDLKVYDARPNMVTSAGATITVRGPGFDKGSYVIFDGPNGSMITPTSVTNQSLTFTMPAATVGVHHIQIGERMSNIPTSVAYNIVMAEAPGNPTQGHASQTSARLIVDGAHSHTYNVGDTVNLLWSASHADQYSSELIASGPPVCKQVPFSSIQSGQGTIQFVVPDTYGSCSWRLLYSARNNSLGFQDMATDSVNIYINPATAQAETSFLTY